MLPQTVVRVHGVVSKAELNGQKARIVDKKCNSERYQVLFDNGFSPIVSDTANTPTLRLHLHL